MAEEEGGSKRSNIVILSLLGVTGVWVIAADANPGTTMRRNLYNDRAACERDYSAPQCEQTGSGTGSSSSGGHGGGGGRWRGPAYAADRTSAAAYGDPGRGRVGLAMSSESSVRGGFGSFGRMTRAIS